MVDAVKRRDKLCRPAAAVDYAYHVAIKDVSGDLINSIDEAVEYGVPSFKVFMVYDFGVKDGVFYQVLEKAKSVGALIEVHAENNEMVNSLQKNSSQRAKRAHGTITFQDPSLSKPRRTKGQFSGPKSLNAPPLHSSPCKQAGG